jgi:hypothetical protein
VVTAEELAFRAGFRARHRLKSVGDEFVEQEAYWEYDRYRREIAEPTRCASCQKMITQGAMCAPCRNSD